MKIQTNLLVTGKDIIAKPVFDSRGVLLLNKGIIVTQKIKERLLKFQVREVFII